MTYKNDPRMITAKFTSACSKCGCSLKKGANIYYWPSDRKAYCEKCGDGPYRQFRSDAADEDMMNGNGPMCLLKKKVAHATFFGRLPETLRPLTPLKSIRQLVFSLEVHSSCQPVSFFLGFCLRNYPVGVAALCSDASWVAGRLRRITTASNGTLYWFQNAA